MCICECAHLVCVHAFMFECIHTCMYMCAHVYVCVEGVACGGQRSTLGVVQQAPFTLFFSSLFWDSLTGLEFSVLTDWPKTRTLFWDRVSHWLELIKQGRPDGHWTPRDPTQYWNHNCVPLCPTLLFNKSSGESHSGHHACRASTFLTESPLRPIKTFFFVCFAFKSASGLVLSYQNYNRVILKEVPRLWVFWNGTDFILSTQRQGSTGVPDRT